MTDNTDDMEMLNEPLLTEDGFVNPACMNELENVLNNCPKTYQRLTNDPEWTKRHWVFKHDITAALAKWAIRQSPYAYPERLDEVVKYLDACLDVEFKKAGCLDTSDIMAELSLCEINKMLYGILHEQGVEAFDNWNKAKNGSEEIVLASRYSKAHPDSDFIDLDALLHNVCIDLRMEFRVNDEFDKKFEEEHGNDTSN